MDFGITLIKRALLALLLLSGIAQGQTLLTVTNARIDVANDPAFTLSGPAGSYRITYTVTAGGTPIDLNDGSTFRLEVWASDGFRTVNITNNSGAEINPSAGQVRFVLPSIGAGQYRLRGIATPVSGDTNASWNLTHHYLTVTNTPASTGVSVTNTSSLNITTPTTVITQEVTEADTVFASWLSTPRATNLTVVGSLIVTGATAMSHVYGMDMTMVMAEIFFTSNATATVITNANQWFPIVGAAVDGQVSQWGSLTAAGTNTITLTNSWPLMGHLGATISYKCASANQTFEFAATRNGGIIPSSIVEEDFETINKTDSTAMHYMVPRVGTNDVVGLAVRNKTGANNITIVNANIFIMAR